jgi:hypothetical protein
LQPGYEIRNALPLDAELQRQVDIIALPGKEMDLRSRRRARIADQDEHIARTSPAENADIEGARSEMILGDRSALEKHVEPRRHQKIIRKLPDTEMHDGYVDCPRKGVRQRRTGGARHAGHQDRRHAPRDAAKLLAAKDVRRIHVVGEQLIALDIGHRARQPHVLGRLLRIEGICLRQAEVVVQRFGVVGLVSVGRRTDADAFEQILVCRAAAPLFLNRQDVRHDRLEGHWRP